MKCVPFKKQEVPMRDWKIYRKRLIPNECIPLKNDIILHSDDSLLITKWNTLKPRSDFHHGYSCYYLNEGYKISRFYKENGSLLYWYCDIITHEVENKNDLIITDLLADVIIYPDGFVQVLDLDELCDAKTQGLITEEQFFLAVKQLGALLDIVYSGHLSDFTSFFINLITEDLH